MTEGERGPAILEMVASVLVATCVVALVAGLATGEFPSPRISFLRGYPSLASIGTVCLGSAGSCLQSVLSAAHRILRVPTDSALLWFARVVVSDSSGGDRGGIDPCLDGGVSRIGVGGGRRCPCMARVGVSS